VRIIAIIRSTEGDFLWESPRLGRNHVVLRVRDSARLSFMMLEFFGGPLPAREAAGLRPLRRR
jgi:hypothetical protein